MRITAADTLLHPYITNTYLHPKRSRKDRREDDAAVKVVKSMVDMFEDFGAEPVLVRAGPGTGKTWMSKQAVFTLADQLGEAADANMHKGVRMVPLIMYVQQIVYVLRDTSPPDVKDLLATYLQKVYTDYEVAMLLQAYDLQALIMVIDGVDEAAGMRKYIEDFVLRVLVPSGNRVLITSRREGIQDLFGMGRLVLVNPVSGPVVIQVAAENADQARALLNDLATD